MKISAIMLTCNEGESLHRVFKSLSWVDEIIVVDDNSTNDTVDIARSYGAKVYVRSLNKDFGAQRNFSISKATGDWIIKMDPDEFVPEATAQKIKETLMRDNNRFAAYKLIRRNVLFGKELKSPVGEECMLRIFKRDRVLFKGSVHPNIIVDGDIGFIDAEILHYPVRSVSDVIRKWNFYTDLELKDMDMHSIEVSFIRRQLTYKMLKLFYKSYIKKGGYKDGIYGLAWVLLQIVGSTIKWLKVLEKKLELQQEEKG